MCNMANNLDDDRIKRLKQTIDKKLAEVSSVL